MRSGVELGCPPTSAGEVGAGSMLLPSRSALPARQYERRAIVVMSLLGVASMMPTMLLQSGIIRDLPEPPIPGFDSRAVNLSAAAFPLGIPDGGLALLAFAANLPLATSARPPGSRRRSWLPLLAIGKSSFDAAVSAWLLYRMPTKERAWCVAREHRHLRAHARRCAQGAVRAQTRSAVVRLTRW